MSRPIAGGSLRASAPEDARPSATEPDGSPAREISWTTHLVWLRSALRRRFGADLADDIAQETYVKIAEHEAAEPIRNVRGLLMAVATNLARDSFRRTRVRADRRADVHDLRLDGDHQTRTAEDDLLVKEAILSLPADLRDVLLLSKIGGLTNREIAQRYGLSVRAIDKRLQRAITLFVARLRD